jgi:hypothetical protein
MEMGKAGRGKRGPSGAVGDTDRGVKSLTLSDQSRCMRVGYIHIIVAANIDGFLCSRC